MRICLMIEGQEDVTWQQWTDLADACEDTGIEGLFRSDHYLSVQGARERGSLDAWTTLAGLARHTSRIRLGTMVSPTTFRHPSVLAKSVVTVDHISGGRAELGIGAGWHKAEHTAHGFAFPSTSTRMEVFAEQIEIVRRQWADEAFDFDGRHYHLKASNALPKPLQKPHPNLIVGGSGGPKSIALAAKWADEYNTVFPSPRRCKEVRGALERAFEKEDRDPGTLTFSIMTGCVLGSDRGDLERRARRFMDHDGESGSPADWLGSLGDEWVAGTVDEVVERLGVLAEAGVDRVMLQHQDHSDVEMVRLLGAEVAPKAM